MSEYTIGVIGNPNCGKTTLFNALTGAKQRVGNWPGVTVDRKVGNYRHADSQIEVVDTPGIRQFELWDVIPEEVASYYRDIRPYVSHCRYPDCTHTHEEECAVKDAVADGRIDLRRYDSYCHVRDGDQPSLT